MKTRNNHNWWINWYNDF